MKRLFTILLALTASLSAAPPKDQTLSLHYDKPAGNSWLNAVPIGNGRLGAMIFGNVNEDRIMLNEDSLWSGWSESKNDRPGSFEALQEARKLIAQKKIKPATQLLLKKFCSLHGYGKKDFGAYQSFFDAHLKFNHHEKPVTNYYRELNLKTATATTTYTHDGTDYTREHIASHSDQVIATHYTANKPGKISFTLHLTSKHKNTQTTSDSLTKNHAQLNFSGQVDNGKNNPAGMRFASTLNLTTDGGTITSTENTLTVTNANSATLIIAGATNYKLQYPEYKGETPESKNKQTLTKLAKKSYAEIKAAHITDHQSLFNRVQLNLGNPDQAKIPTNQRIRNYKKNKTDHNLEALLFQYGRYLLIASSRPGGLPANLQGLWNDSNTPPWNGDYHLNINMQMNYWPVDQCNLSECATPLIQWANDLQKPGAKSAKIHYNSKGWVAHHSANAWGFTPPGPARGHHMLEAESAAFLCQNLWDHYAYTQDQNYLKNSLWPTLKGASDFWIDNLQEVEGGFLAVSPSYSPEQGPLSDGAYYQTMIIWDLFTHTITAAEKLNKDKAYIQKLTKLRARLQPPSIGKHGQLKEWRDPALEKGVTKNKHRHVSHMWAIYPGHQITPELHKDLTAAAIQSMNYRGDHATGWSMGWKINLWARFRDGNRALKITNNFISDYVYDNLFCKHPPFQIDGNFGYTAAVAEMLVQSHTKTQYPYSGNYHIQLLPALPDAWKNGSIQGLKTRGNFTISNLSWEKGILKTVSITSSKGGTCSLTYKDKTQKVILTAGQSKTLTTFN